MEKKLSRVYLCPWAAVDGSSLVVGQVSQGPDGVIVLDRASKRIQFFSWSAIVRIDYGFAP